MIHLLVPAFNEAENVGGVVDAWRTIGKTLGREVRFLFVDDGSTDGTAARLASLGGDVTVLVQPARRGPGAAFERGFNHLLPLAADGDVVVTAEADNTSAPGVALALLAALDAGADIAIAAFHAPGGGTIGVPAHRRLFSVVINRFLVVLFRLKGVTSPTCFYRAWRPSLLGRVAAGEPLRLSCPGFAAMSELLLRAAVAGARIEEVPLVIDWTRRRGRSGMRIGRTIAEYGRLLVATAPLWVSRWVTGARA